jgi:hypothetical protein
MQAHEMLMSWKNLRCLLSFKHFTLYSEASRNSELLIIHFSGPFLFIIIINTDSDYICRCNLEISHQTHAIFNI